MEAVFKALSDPHRRALLDQLHGRDGQTLAELDAPLPMTRFGTMKHLRVLEAAGLVITRRVGREKLHFLNPVPIRLLHDRWIHKYAEPWVSALGDLKRELETPTGAPAFHSNAAKENAMPGPKHVYEVYIRTTPDKLWEAIMRPELTRKYFYDSTVESNWTVGSSVVHRAPDGSVALEGQVLEIDPPRRLVTTFSGRMDPEGSKDRPSRVTWEIVSMGPVCKLTLLHDDFDGATRTYEIVGMGWNPVLSGLKTLLETGQPLGIPSPAERTASR